LAEGQAPPIQVEPPTSVRRYWTRDGIAHWLVEQLADGAPTLIGIDHGFSFPLRYFEAHDLKFDWYAFLEDFQKYWPTDDQKTWVRDILRTHAGGSRDPGPLKNCFRLTEKKAKTAKSVLNFDVKQGCVAFSTHAGIPWLRFDLVVTRDQFYERTNLITTKDGKSFVWYEPCHLVANGEHREALICFRLMRR
jgi:hypothetical protein